MSQNTDRTLQLIGLARKAGLIAVGGEAVSAAARKGKARLVLSASDSSEGSSRRARMNAEAAGVTYIMVPFTKFELGSITGRGSPGTVAILDSGLAAGFVQRLAEKEPDRYAEAAQRLTKEAQSLAEKKKQTPRRTAQ